jgi:hypothetical protein
MKIDDLIKHLNEMRGLYGNVEIFISTRGTYGDIAGCAALGKVSEICDFLLLSDNDGMFTTERISRRTTCTTGD